MHFKRLSLYFILLVVISTSISEETIISMKNHYSIRNNSQLFLENESHYWGVIISIGDYKGNEHDIPLNRSELLCLYNALLSASNWNKSRIKLLINENATQNAIVNAFNWLKENVDTQDIVLFSYLGHGGELPDVNGDEKDGYDEGIIPWEGMDGFISDDELGKKFNEINAKGMCIIFDCCLSGDLIDKKQLIKHKIYNRAIIPHSSLVNKMIKTRKQRLLELIVIDEKHFPFQNDVTIYKNKVAILSLDPEKIGVIIESKNIYEDQLAIFNLAWEGAKQLGKLYN